MAPPDREEATMTRNTSEPSGDYGYDLVHEQVTTERQPPVDPGQRPAGHRPEDTGGDYGYDEAHGF